MEESKAIYALESIDRQTDAFGETLTATMQIVVDEIKDKKKITAKHPAVVKLRDQIYDRLGIKVGFDVNSDAIAAIYPFFSNRNHIFLDELFRGKKDVVEGQTELLDTMVGKKGNVDLKKAKVSGIFSEYEHPLHFNFVVLSKLIGLSASEMVAVLLHELGHAFYGCYYANRTDRTNQVLTQLNKHITSTDTRSVDYIYKELSTVSPDITKAEIDSVINGNRVIAGLTWFKVTTKVVRSSTVNGKYDETSFEQLADNFPSRFGMGKPLATGLEKMSGRQPETNRGLFVISRIYEIIKLAFACFSLARSILSLNIPAVAFALIQMLINIHSEGEHKKDYTYDKLKFRYKRIRDDAVEQLKNPNLNKEIVKMILSDIAAIDEIMNKTMVYDPILTKIANFIFSNARDAKKAIDNEQLMEDLSANDLFLKSSELRLV